MEVLDEPTRERHERCGDSATDAALAEPVGRRVIRHHGCLALHLVTTLASDESRFPLSGSGGQRAGNAGDRAG